MPRPESYLLADVDLGAVAEALSEWRWLIGGSWVPLWVSSAGDVFLTNSAGSVARLDTGSGTLREVAASVRELESRLADPEVVDDLFLAPVIAELRRSGKVLASGQCYGFTVLPIFSEGSYTAENRFVLSALEHIGYTGDMHLQLRDIRDGQKVEVKVV